MADDNEKVYEATRFMLAQHLKSVPYPMPVSSEADLAAIVSRAFLHGAGFVAEAMGLNGTMYVALAAKIMQEHAVARGGRAGSLVIAGEAGGLH